MPYKAVKTECPECNGKKYIPFNVHWVCTPEDERHSGIKTCDLCKGTGFLWGIVQESEEYIKMWRYLEKNHNKFMLDNEGKSCVDMFIELLSEKDNG